MANDKPGRDLLAWIKKMKSIEEKDNEELKKLLNNEKEPPEWLPTSKTLLPLKNKITNQAQNYRPPKHHVQSIYSYISRVYNRTL